MLVLTRKCEESIIIENNIEVKILKIQGNQVHIGVNAPKTVSIYRSEIYAQVKAQNQSAVHAADGEDRLKTLERELGAFKKLIEGGVVK